jgi:sugar lactone lactonase YvrE
MTTTSVANGTNVPYTITGVSTSDIGGASLTGNFTINNNTASVTLNITADSTTEGVETLTMTSSGQTVSVIINDTSISLAGNVTTVASNFFSLRWCDVDSNDNLYIAEQDRNQIRKVTPLGVVTAVTPSEQYGYVDGPASSAQFANPQGAVVDSTGNIFVGDRNNHCIRKISVTGDVTTFAGGVGNPAVFSDGPAAVATFNKPHGMAIDASNNLYVADQGNVRVRKITPSGEVTTFAGPSEFNYLTDVALDSTGNVYTADMTKHRICKCTPSGVVTTLAGSNSDVSGFVDGQGTDARFNRPSGLAVDSNDNIYVADGNNSAIRKITPGGYVTTITGGTGGYVDGDLASAQFSSVYDISVLSNGDILVSDETKVRKITFTTPTYALTRSAASVNEGGSVTFTMTTTDVADGVNVPYTITGVSTSDIDGAPLTGNFTINSNTASVTFDITADATTEGTETMTMTSGGQTATVTINDTSVNLQPLFDRSTFTAVPEPYRTYLNQAATRFETYIKIPSNVWDEIKAARSSDTSGTENWAGIRLVEYTERNYGVGHPQKNLIAACGPRNIYDLVQPGSNGLTFQAAGFALEINKYWETGIPTGETSPYESADWVDILMHELGHGIGIGTFWQAELQQYGAVPPVDFFLDDIYANAQQGYNTITNNTYIKMPLEDSGGSTTAAAHWEADFRPGTAVGANGVSYPGIINELMVGYYTKGMGMKLTKLSIGALKDFGYEEVNPGTSEGVPTIDSSLIAALNAGQVHKMCCHRSVELADKTCVGTIVIPASGN